MVRPDDDAPFLRRWIPFIRALLVNPSVISVARVAGDHADYHDGTGVYLGHGRTARAAKCTPKSVANAWKVMRALGMAELTRAGSREGKANEYDLMIPDNWIHLPLLGPNEGPFTCQFCDHAFDPSTSSLVFKKDGTVRWRVAEMVFCPPPQRRKGGPVPPSCFERVATATSAERQPPVERSRRRCMEALSPGSER
jgi:hypothetical protein